MGLKTQDQRHLGMDQSAGSARYDLGKKKLWDPAITCVTIIHHLQVGSIGDQTRPDLIATCAQSQKMKSHRQNHIMGMRRVWKGPS